VHRSGTAFATAADAALNTKLRPPFSPYRESDYDLLFLHGAPQHLFSSTVRPSLLSRHQTQTGMLPDCHCALYVEL
jgi:hypothetical protein